jgi:protoheme IX farnesyltransferase
MAEVAATASATAISVRDVLGIFKARIGITIMMSAVGGLAVTPGPLPEVWRATLLALAVFLASASAGAFNQWAEADLDARMKRTQSRPFASGRLEAGTQWLLVILGLLAFAVLLAGVAANAWSALYTFLGAFTYGIVYTVWLKRRTWLNIVVGGLAGSFAVLAGAAAVNPTLALEPLVLALVLFLWTPPHFWSLAMAVSDDYARNGVPMLPNVVGNRTAAIVIFAHTAALSLLALVPAFHGMGRIYLAFAIAGGAYFTWESARLIAQPTRARAIRNFLASLLQLTALLLGAYLDRWLPVGM